MSCEASCASCSAFGSRNAAPAAIQKMTGGPVQDLCTQRHAAQLQLQESRLQRQAAADMVGLAAHLLRRSRQQARLRTVDCVVVAWSAALHASCCSRLKGGRTVGGQCAVSVHRLLEVSKRELELLSSWPPSCWGWQAGTAELEAGRDIGRAAASRTATHSPLCTLAAQHACPQLPTCRAIRRGRP